MNDDDIQSGDQEGWPRDPWLRRDWELPPPRPTDTPPLALRRSSDVPRIGFWRLFWLWMIPMLVGALCGFRCGCEYQMRAERAAAVRAGAGRWVADPATGTVKFRYTR